MASSPAIKNNLWLASEVAPIFAQTPEAQAMNAAVDKYYPGLRQNANIWTENAVGAWVSGLLLEDALKAGGLSPSTTPTAAEIVQGLQSLHGDTLQGMAPPLTFTAGKPHLVDCWSVQRLENGVPTVLNNGGYTCKPGSSA
jgi:branched-chain amino acid transport system substrate-binding protein